jgi:hypothetical protein
MDVKLLSEIRKEPLHFMPEVSLTALLHFWQGYSARCRLENRPTEDILEGHGQEFDAWVRERFGVSRSYFNVFSVIESFAANGSEAFETFWTMRNEFLSGCTSPEEVVPVTKPEKHLNLLELIRAIRERPGLYLGRCSFRHFYLHIMGDERAWLDCGLAQGEDRRIFSDFKGWVEKKKNQAGHPRLWYNIISYYGVGCDCGYTKDGAFTLLYRWLDEFASEIGQPDLFKVESDWRRDKSSSRLEHW